MANHAEESNAFIDNKAEVLFASYLYIQFRRRVAQFETAIESKDGKKTEPNVYAVIDLFIHASCCIRDCPGLLEPVQAVTGRRQVSILDKWPIHRRYSVDIQNTIRTKARTPTDKSDLLQLLRGE